jgi:glycosyltransferase involved in cell wall biosynthesis
VPEIVGDAGLLVGADDVDGWVDAIDAVLTDAALRDRLVAAGDRRWRRFEQVAVSKVLADAYRETEDA